VLISAKPSGSRQANPPVSCFQKNIDIESKVKDTVNVLRF
jgi:hypothetical protein